MCFSPGEFSTRLRAESTGIPGHSGPLRQHKCELAAVARKVERPGGLVPSLIVNSCLNYSCDIGIGSISSSSGSSAPGVNASSNILAS
jgi:hypothetical protein